MRLPRTPSLSLLLLLAAPASVAAYPGAGSETPIPLEHQVTDLLTQSRFHQGQVWQGFVERNPGAWRVRFDERSGLAHQVWGEGIQLRDAAGTSLGGDASRDDIIDGALRLLRAEQEMLGPGVKVEDLHVTHAERVGDLWYLRLGQNFGALPVYGAEVDLRVKNGRAIVLGFDTRPTARLASAEAGLTAPEACEAVLSFHQGSGLRCEGAPALVVDTPAALGAAEGRLAWVVEVRGDAPPLWKRHRVDAATGEVIGTQELLLHATGTVELEVEERTVGDPIVTEPANRIPLYHSAGAELTDVDGFFSFSADSVDFSARLDGAQVRVYSEAGAEYSWDASVAGDDNLVVLGVPDGADSTGVDQARAQLGAYANTSYALEHARTLRPEYQWGGGAITVTVNRTDPDGRFCNAFFDGDLNFYRRGGGCNNTGRIADVVFHEFGHGFHYFGMLGGSFDTALSEGLSDYYSATLVNDPLLAPGFVESGAGLRECDSDLVWPQDIDSDPHITGLIIAGALWDLRTTMIDSYGYDEGRRLADGFMAAVAAGADDIPAAYAEVLAWDDDDGNLANGTPHQCAIAEAFARHGLGDGTGDGGLFVNHEQVRSSPLSTDGYPIELQISSLGEECATFDPGNVEVEYWLADGGASSLASLQESGDGLWAGRIGADFPDDSLVRYRIRVPDTESGLVVELPSPGGAEDSFQFYVGSSEVLFEEDFESLINTEAGFGGWTHGLLSGGSADEGADDWQVGVPAGRGGDPGQAFSGRQCVGNDLGLEENWDGRYQNNRTNYLDSPEIDVSGAERVRLQFRRWLAVEDGYYDQATVEVNGREVWANRVSGSDNPDHDDHHEDNFWFLFDADITDFVVDDIVQVRFLINSDQGLQFGGWNIDDFQILMPVETETVEPGDPSSPGDGPDIGFGPDGAGCSCAVGSPERPLPSALWLGLLGLLVPLRRRRASRA